ncbi:MAG: glycosyltransferase N-terminal domain-containing protein, partial [Bacillota bacterium]
MTRALYALVGWIAIPFVVARLAWRARKQRGYLERLGERFGRYGTIDAGPRIWIHAVSVGETRAAAPLVAALRERFPRHRILLTHMTPTGRATGAALFGGQVEQAWLPYDLGFAVRRFLDRFRPAIGILLETEIWPRLLEESRRAGIPVVLANARLSARSAARYARAPSITRWALANLAGIAAQTDEDAQRFVEIGARAPVVTGNVKFDMAVPGEMLERG